MPQGPSLDTTKHLRGDFALGNVRGCQLEGDRHPVRGAQQVQLEPQKKREWLAQYP